MNYCIVVFASFATAKRVKGLVQKKYNINSEIMQTPSKINARGCSYSLKIKYGDIDSVWNLVKSSGLSSKGIYLLDNYEKIR